MGGVKKDEEKREDKKEIKKQLNHEHIGFHTLSHERELWYGNGDPISCFPFINRCTIRPYTIQKLGERYQYVYFDINGYKRHCQASVMAMKNGV